MRPIIDNLEQLIDSNEANAMKTKENWPKRLKKSSTATSSRPRR